MIRRRSAPPRAIARAAVHAPRRGPSARALGAALLLPLLLAGAGAPTTASHDGQPPAARRDTARRATTGKRAKPAPAPRAAKAAPAAGNASPDSSREARLDARWASLRMPAPLPGAILPARRIVAYYGNPHSKRMGVLGEYPLEQMLVKLDAETRKWNAADPSRPVQPALHLIAVVAQGAAGTDGKWRRRESAAMIEKVHGWARQKNALLFLDVQIGKSTLEEELQVLLPYLSRPDVHLGIDPEFAMTKGGDPGRRVGSYDARHINQAIDVLGELVTRHKLPPKVLVVHRFTGPMVTNSDQIRLDPRVQVVMHMDGWGPPYGKRATWSRFIRPFPVQFTGFKLFYHNDTKAGHPLMQPKEVLALKPAPVYIQYQ